MGLSASLDVVSASLALKIAVALLACMLWIAGLREVTARGARAERAEFVANLAGAIGVYLISTTTFRTVSAWAADLGSAHGRVAKPVLALVLSFLLVDLVSYGYHVGAHKLRPLWTLHVVHHSGRYFNLSLGTRQSWLERALVTPLCYVVVILPVASALGLRFEYLLLGHQLVYLIGFLNHTSALEWWPWGLRKVLINPIEHRVHHGIAERHFDCNYGFALSLWDKLFGTYLAPDGLGSEIQVGVAEYPIVTNPIAVQAQTFVALAALLGDAARTTESTLVVSSSTTVKGGQVCHPK